jgi:hypothetical protein
MNAKEFITRLNDLISRNNRESRLDEFRVGIQTTKLNSIGGTYITDIKSVNFGFDWDNNKLLIYPEKELREIDLNELDNIRKELERIGWDQFQNRNLKRENKKLKERISELEGEKGSKGDINSLVSTSRSLDCVNKRNGSCTLHNIFCKFPDCEK